MHLPRPPIYWLNRDWVGFQGGAIPSEPISYYSAVGLDAPLPENDTTITRGTNPPKNKYSGSDYQNALNELLGGYNPFARPFQSMATAQERGVGEIFRGLISFPRTRVLIGEFTSYYFCYYILEVLCGSIIRGGGLSQSRSGGLDYILNYFIPYLGSD